VRVIAGQAKSHPLRFPKGAKTRPTTDAMRESLFSSLGSRVVDARFADLYAGCGSVGIEALSRGAREGLFVDSDGRCTAVMARNLADTGLKAGAKVVRGRVERVWGALSAQCGPFDIVFADPPYGLASFGEFARRLALRWEGVALGGLVVLQCGAGYDGLGLGECTRVKQFGETVLLFFERP